MRPGRLIAVVGPSGVGKDSVMAGIHAACPGMRLVRRTITRPPDQAGEAYDSVSEPEFLRLAATGAFSLSWQAHGTHYGIPSDIRATLAEGRDCLANLSRGVLEDARRAFDDLVVLHLTATPETLARRLAARGRESGGEIAGRLARAGSALPPGLEAITLSNDGALGETVAQAVAALQPVRA